MIETVLNWITQYGYVMTFSLLMLGVVGLPVPDETILTFTGYLIYKGIMSPFPAVAAAVLGSICGISLSYAIGRTGGVYLLRRYGTYLHATPETMGKVRSWFRRRGRWLLVFGYFLPGIRHLSAIAAGMSKMEPAGFATFAYTGALLWSAAFVSLGYAFGKEWEKSSSLMHRYLLIGAAIVAAVALLSFFWKRRHWGKGVL